MNDREDVPWAQSARAPGVAADDLVAVHVPTGPIDPDSLVRRGARAVFDAASGPGGGPVVAGFGEASRASGHGEARFAEIEASAAQLFGALRGPAAGDARLLGGVAFAQGEDGADGLGEATFVLPRWTWVADARGERVVLVAPARELLERAEALRTEADALFGESTHTPLPPAVRDVRSVDDGAAAFVSRVEAANAAIEGGTFEKVVVGRRVELDLGAPADPDAVWSRLRRRELGTMRLFWRDAGAALLAATPERLVVRDGARVIIDALAGTSPRDDDDAGAIARLMASDKDRREHDVVVRAVAQAVAGLGGLARFGREPTPRTLRAVHHLSTEIDAVFDVPPHVLRLASVLHPTPAVAGAPRAAATAFLRAHEADRGWFTGAFGWFDARGQGAFAVILRALLLRGARAHLFAGTGIVRGSDPALELAETEAKLRAARGALGLETPNGGRGRSPETTGP